MGCGPVPAETGSVAISLQAVSARTAAPTRIALEHGRNSLTRKAGTALHNRPSNSSTMMMITTKPNPPLGP